MINKPSYSSLLYTKLLISSFIFFPASLILLFFSLFALVNHKIPFTISIHNPEKVQASEIQNILITPTIQPQNVIPEEDIRVTALRHFFTDLQSPLSDESETLVREADLNNLDYRLIPAISMQESQACKRIPANSHNCWGYGIYGKKITKFDSFETAIEKVAKTLKDSYQDDGLTNATLVEDKWTPSSQGEWSYGVNTYLGKIRDYEKSLSYSSN